MRVWITRKRTTKWKQKMKRGNKMCMYMYAHSAFDSFWFICKEIINRKFLFRKHMQTQSAIRTYLPNRRVCNSSAARDTLLWRDAWLVGLRDRLSSKRTLFWRRLWRQAVTQQCKVPRCWVFLQGIYYVFCLSLCMSNRSSPMSLKCTWGTLACKIRVHVIFKTNRCTIVAWS